MNAYILRGLPGSGKSTLAARLAEDWGAVFSTDSYFMVDGLYRFDPTKLSENHAKNLEAFKTAVRGKYPTVVVDNTNMLRAHFAPYVEAAEKEGYLVQILTVGSPRNWNHQVTCSNRNIHGVSLEVIQNMARKFED